MRIHAAIIISGQALAISAFQHFRLSFQTSSKETSELSSLMINDAEATNLDRRQFSASVMGIAGGFMFGANAPAFAANIRTGAADGNLPDLPPEAARSYLQYRVALQTSADYYLFELQDSVTDTDQWGEIGQLFTSSGARGGQGQPNRIERDFVNPMRVIELSMPPDAADELRDARFKFERAMQIINKATAGIRRDLPVEIPASAVTSAKTGWEEGRKAFNEYLLVLNDTTGFKGELKTIPPGPKSVEQYNAYGRSQRRFFDLMKKTKLCQNRGGKTLSNTWGGLMVSGYLQDSCGIPDMDDYFFQ